MRILVVDDNQKKVAKLVEHLGRHGVQRPDITICSNAGDARKSLRDSEFDLLILDILLPQLFEGEPAKSVSLDLLREIAEGARGLRRPRYIVALTAFRDAMKETEAHLREGGLWQVVEFDETSNKWLITIGNCVTYIRNASRDALGRAQYGCDVCIVTALPTPEMDAVHRYIAWEWQAPITVDDNTYVRWGRLRSGMGDFSALAAVASRMGMVASALIAAKLIERYHPRFLVMPGICAGVEGRVRLGDVVLGDPTWDYQSGKRVGDRGHKQFAIAPHQRDVSQFVRTRFENLKNDRNFWNAIHEGWLGAPDALPKLVIGPMGTGSSVVADADLVGAVKGQHRDLVAIEMEAYGLYEAAALASFPRPTTFALKSVCDFADNRKNDDTQNYAAYTSTRTLQEFFERYLHEIVSLAGS